MISLDALPGNEALKASLRHALAGRFPQTVLLTGENGEALLSLARALAAALFCEGDGQRPCGVCVPCRKVASDVHPDLTVVDEGDDELKVELARRLKAENAIVPNDGERRVTVICHAHRLNPAAQNALLKLLEEPPAYAFFLLLSEQPDALLETVRSRCVTFSLEPDGGALPEAEAADLIGPYFAALAAGREERLMAAALAMEKTPRRALVALLGLMQTALRDAILRAHGLQTVPLAPGLAAETDKLSRAIAPARLTRLADFLYVLQDRVSRNAAAAAVTLSLTSDAFRICYLE